MNNTPTTKTCTRCGLIKTPHHFHKNGPGLRSQCKPCVNALARQRYAKEKAPSLWATIMNYARIANSEPLEVSVLRDELEGIARQARVLLMRRIEILKTIETLTQ